MKSIRASLIVYFWLLLGLGLGGASLLAYRIAADSLRTKQEATRKLLDTQFEDRKREVEARFDDLLLAKARVVASQVRAEGHWDRAVIAQYFATFALTDASQAALVSLFTTPSPTRSPWLATVFSRAVRGRLSTEIKLDESELPRDPDGGVAEFFQVDT